MHRRLPGRSCSLFAALLLTAIATAQAPGTPEGDLRSKSIDTRLAAIDTLGNSDRTDLDRWLLPLLKDKDWEVQERTAMALGKAKCQPALKALVELALDGDVVRIRQAAARAAAAVDPVETANNLLKKAKGKAQLRSPTGQNVT